MARLLTHMVKLTSRVHASLAAAARERSPSPIVREWELTLDSHSADSHRVVAAVVVAAAAAAAAVVV